MRSNARSNSSLVLRSLAALATLYTLGVHVYLAAAPNSPDPIHRGLFWLASAGFLAGLIGFFVPHIWARMAARLVLIGSAGGAIIGYLMLFGTTFTPLALSSKIDEAVLIILLVADAALDLRALGSRGPGAADERGEETSVAAA